MEKLNISVGIKRYQLVEGGAALSFNPSDPNVYARYMEMIPKIKSVEQEMAEKAKYVNINSDDAGEQTLRIMRETDRRMKDILNEIFGKENNFDDILMGVNLMAVTEGGNRVINNVLDALTPIMNAGAKSCVETEVNSAKLNREQRRAMQ
jgi:hypothetical protein